ncbi:hypothetical protein, partial [Limosilactobacillus ingluviei]
YTEDIKSQLGGYLCMEEKQDIVETIFKSKATPATKPLKRSHRSIELNVKHIRLTLFQGVDSELAAKIITTVLDHVS